MEVDPLLSSTIGRDVFFVSPDGQRFYQTLLTPKQSAEHDTAASQRRTLLTQTPQLGPLVLDWRTTELKIIQNHPANPDDILSVSMQPCPLLDGINLFLAPLSDFSLLDGPIQTWWKKNGEILSPLLVIEDEELVRNTYRRTLPRRGFQKVEFAATFEEGLALLRSHSDIPAVLSDFNLNNNHTGVELAAQILRERQGLRFLFVSGKVGELQQDLLAAGLERFNTLEKPVSLAELEANLRQLFDGIDF